MLDDLVSVIETLQQRIATHRQSLQQNEIRTRTALIDPLLTALGWDVSDPALVIPEYRVNVQTWADYALAGSGNQPAAVPRSQAAGFESLENHLDADQWAIVRQRTGHSILPALTDGSHWQLYRTILILSPLTNDKIVLNLSEYRNMHRRMSVRCKCCCSCGGPTWRRAGQCAGKWSRCYVRSLRSSWLSRTAIRLRLPYKNCEPELSLIQWQVVPTRTSAPPSQIP